MMVLDTHVFFWYILGDPRLPSQTRDQMTLRPEGVYVPSVCMWELMMLIQRGRVGFQRKGDAGQQLKKRLREAGFQEAPLTTDIAILSRTLPFTHEDPADRFIAATARALGFPLATSDQKLRSLGWLKLAY